MLEKIIDQYKGFSDSVISEISYKRFLSDSGFDNGIIDIILRSENKNADYEIVKLQFSEIISFRFIEIENSPSLIINEALIKKANDVIIFDFFPLIQNSEILENIESDLIIKCKNISFEILKFYTNGSKII
ncbi:hypothetical protein ACQKCJ_16875 [Flavobacterium sp. NPDC079362]|uniref:hypothetical protein n=1 Tax=Flavobacterium sp. NPDC079362 TaxID=3390566 RepID=UPI003D003277